MKTKNFTNLLLALLMLQLGYLNAQDANSLSFDGVNNYVEIAGDPLNSIGTGEFTIEAWIKGDAAAQTAHPMIMSNRGTSSFGGGIFIGFHDQWGGSNHKMLNFQVDGNNWFFINNGEFDGNVLDNTCHHIAITRSETDLSFYIDGNLIGTKNSTNMGSINNDHPLWIGKDKATNNTFDGNISQVRIWNVARTETEIQDLMNMSIINEVPGLMAYWGMTEGEGQQVADMMDTYNGQLGQMSSEDSNDPAWSDEGCVVETPVSTNDLDPTTVGLFPNPTSGLITINSTNQEALFIEVIDITGKVLLQEKMQATSTNIDMSEYPSGVYHVQMTSAGRFLTEKVVKL